MSSKPFIYLEYKYPEQPWKEYDRTQVIDWADTQMARMVREYPQAEYRRRLERKK